MTDEGNSKNSSSALAKLLNQLNVPTLALILLTGGSNLFATKQAGDEGRAEAIRQIRDLHNALDEFENRQKDILQNQTTILGILREGQKQYMQRQQRLFPQHPEEQ
jgi:hypothetical protein